MDYCFITDLHLSNNCRVRSGSVLDDLARKLEFVRDYCNVNDCTLLIGGDLFDKATVPDLVKNAIFPIFAGFNHKPIAISGNHDTLYGNRDYNYKTSYQTLVSSGLIIDLDEVECIDDGSVILTSLGPWENDVHKSLITRGKPQVCLFHGILNTPDGVNTFTFQDIQTQDQCFICLGHDHVEYEDLNFTDKVRIIRPGSFLRGTRQDTNKREPKIVHIKCLDGRLVSKKVPIKARPWEEIFTMKQLQITKAQQSDIYDQIISQLRNAQQSDMTFEQAIKMVAEPDVVEYIKNTLEEANLEKSTKRV